MAIDLGPIVIKTQLDDTGVLEGLGELLNEEALERIDTFVDSFDELHDSLAVIIDDMFNLQDASQGMVIGVSASFFGLTRVLDATGRAWQQMLLTGELSADSFGRAMQTLVAQELAAISARALVNALFATATGLLNLALFNFPGAASAFAAAAAFGAVAAVAGAGAIALAPSAGGGDAGAFAGPGGGGPLPQQTDQVEQQNQRNVLQIIIEGNIIGQSEFVEGELIPAINKAIIENDAVMVSTDVTALGSVSGVST